MFSINASRLGSNKIERIGKAEPFNLATTASRIVVMGLALSVLTSCTTLGSQSGSVSSQPDVDLFLVSVNAQKAYQQSRWLDAARFYQEIVEHVPSDAIAWFRLANTYAQQGALERAIHAYQQSLTHDSEQPKVWFNLSTAYLLNGQSAMQQAHARMRATDPARMTINARVHRLGELIHGRAEEGGAGFTSRR